MKPYDRILVTEASEEDNVAVGQTGVITDLLQGDDVIVAMLELDESSYEDDDDDDGLRSLPVTKIKVIEPSTV